MSRAAGLQAKLATQRWLHEVVIGLNFCPFAKREVAQNTIRYSICDKVAKQQVLSHLQQELELLDADPKTQTTLLILAQGHEDFFDYLDLLDQAQRLLDSKRYSGIYQLASFHPDYLFQGEAADSVANYTNRSPFPMLHLLREDSVEKAVAAYKNPQDIPSDNIAKAQEIGLTTLQRMLLQCHQS